MRFLKKLFNRENTSFVITVNYYNHENNLTTSPYPIRKVKEYMLFCSKMLETLSTSAVVGDLNKYTDMYLNYDIPEDKLLTKIQAAQAYVHSVDDYCSRRILELSILVAKGVFEKDAFKVSTTQAQCTRLAEEIVFRQTTMPRKEQQKIRLELREVFSAIYL